MTSTPVEFEDAYIIEERNIKIEDDDDEELKELTIDSLNLSDEEDLVKMSNDYDKLKLAAEMTRRKNEKVERNKESSIGEFIPRHVRRDEVVEDYIRNFFVHYNLNKTLEEFNKEYNELAKKGKFFDNNLGPITDVNIKNAKLDDKKKKMSKELEKAKKNAEEARSQWESLRKERDFHKENFHKVEEEKKLIAKDIKALEELHEGFESKIGDLNQKYEHLCKSKSLLKLDVDKLTREVEEIEKNISRMQVELDKLDNKQKAELLDSKQDIKSDKRSSIDRKLIPGEITPWPAESIRNNLYLMQTYSSLNINPNLTKSIRSSDEKSADDKESKQAKESKSIASMSVHIKKQIVAVGRDDSSFLIYDMVNYKELVHGKQGHFDYVSGIDIHPKVAYLATASGDNTVKLWDLNTLSIKTKFEDHKSIVWSVKFLDTGDFLLSCAENSTIKLWDLNAMKSRMTYYGHTNSVNKVNFQPFSNYFASCSADKTISIWDFRTGKTEQTYYGHLNSINDVVFNTSGNMLYSCDSDGIVKIWDIRKVEEAYTYHFFDDKISANCLEADKSNSVLYVGYNNGKVSTVNLTKNTKGSSFEAHKGSVNAMGTTFSNSHLYTAGSDGVLNIWN